MAYVGNPIDTKNTFQSLQGKRFSGDGSETEFTLDIAPSSTLDIEVFVGNVRQDPNSAYTLSGTTLTFTGAPPSGTNNIYVVHQAKSVGTIDPPANSVGVTQLNLSDGSNGQFIQTNGSGTLSFASVASLAGIDDQSSSNDDQLTITDTAVIINEDSDDVDFRVESNGNANMLHVDGGNDGVAIGTTGGAHTLQVYDTTDFVSGDSNVANTAPLNVRSAASTGGIGAISIGGNDNVALYNHGANVLGLQAYDGIQFYCSQTNDDKIGTKTERMRIRSDGNVGIGDTGSSSIKLKIQNDNLLLDMHSTNTSQSGTLQSITCARDAEGNEFNFLICKNNNSDDKLIIRNDGDVQNVNNSYGSISDERFKQNITNANSQWNDIKALKIRNFQTKQEPTLTQLGVVAQELEASGMNGLVDEVPPTESYVQYHSDFGSIDSEDNFTAGQNIKTVKYSVLYMKALKALQEAITKIESLEARVTTLEG